MMKRIWRSLSHDHNLEMERQVESRVIPGVVLCYRRVTQGLRLDFLKGVRELARKSEFLKASDELVDQAEAAIVQSDIDRLYVETCLSRIKGLWLFGRKAMPGDLFYNAPSELFDEALAEARRQFGLTEQERKN